MTLDLDRSQPLVSPAGPPKRGNDTAQVAVLYTSAPTVVPDIGRAMRAQEGQPRRIGILGLGCGTLAAYGRAGDTTMTARIAITWQQSLFSVVVSLITILGTGLVLIVGGLHVMRGRMTTPHC